MILLLRPGRLPSSTDPFSARRGIARQPALRGRARRTRIAVTMPPRANTSSAGAKKRSSVPGPGDTLSSNVVSHAPCGGRRGHRHALRRRDRLGTEVKHYRSGAQRGPDHRYELPRDPFVTKHAILGAPTWISSGHGLLAASVPLRAVQGAVDVGLQTPSRCALVRRSSRSRLPEAAPMQGAGSPAGGGCKMPGGEGRATRGSARRRPPW
jgi:hypothetical protein